jgi:RNA polymerase sigma-70 factor (ECF subfamily)
MGMIFNLCYKIMRDYDDANDCAQDTFVKIYNNLNKFQFKSSFTTWAYRIAVNTCKNSLMTPFTRLKQKTVRLDNPGSETLHTMQVKDMRSDPQKQFDSDEIRNRIGDALETLSHDLKILVILRDFEGKSYDEISVICKMKIGTVKSKLARARHILRDHLTGVL